MSSLAMPSTVRKSQLGFASVSRTLAQSGVVPVLDVVPVLGHEDLRADHPESLTGRYLYSDALNEGRGVNQGVNPGDHSAAGETQPVAGEMTAMVEAMATPKLT